MFSFQAQAKNPPPGTGTSDIPANITITVYSLLGAKVIELPEFPAEESFIAIPWDGKSESGNTLANGAYF